MARHDVAKDKAHALTHPGDELGDTLAQLQLHDDTPEASERSVETFKKNQESILEGLPRPEQVPLYQYEPLEAGELRLLKPVPGTPVTFQLSHGRVDMLQEYDYFALSYCWGPKVIVGSISVMGRLLPVRHNLQTALAHLVSFAISNDAYIWIDALCINQDDLDERSSQVLLMASIYSNASLVVAWLGPAALDSDLAMDHIRKLTAKFEEVILATDGTNGSDLYETYEPIARDERVACGIPGSDSHVAWRAIDQILRRDWWERAWIVQEVTGWEAMDNVIIYCGSKHISWSAIQWLPVIMRQIAPPSGMLGDVSFGAAGRISRLTETADLRHGSDEHDPFDVLGKLRIFDCENPRDKIYAFLEFIGAEFRKEVVPDYKKPFGKVYEDEIERSISRGGSQALSFLGHVFRPTQVSKSTFSYDCDDRLPSWSPDWRSTILWQPFAKRGPSRHAEDSSRMYNASLEHRTKAHIEDGHLLIEGLLVDEIAQTLLSKLDAMPDLEEIYKAWYPADPEAAYFTGQTVKDAFCHTLVADCNVGTESSERGHCLDPSLLLFDGAGSDEKSAEKRNNMEQSLIRATSFRRFIWTKGGYMGLAPAAAEVNDKICVLFGGQVLYAIRESMHFKYEFVGECYIHGLMDGEVLDNFGDVNAATVTFEFV